MKAVFPVAFSASLLFIPVLGCNSDSADDTVVEASRSERISEFADDVCDQYEKCEGFGEGKAYATEDDCERDYESKAGSLWPEAQCNDRQIDSNNYQACLAQVQAYACSSGAASIAEGIQALDKCSAANVCTDPAD
ncbi:MAG: hypothetical protein EOO75_01010 [Myxococcales bacterium]|nr:MAG: hypothetical protein EOO75_01010 [Myxococcales bacterium]